MPTLPPPLLCSHRADPADRGAATAAPPDLDFDGVVLAALTCTLAR